MLHCPLSHDRPSVCCCVAPSVIPPAYSDKTDLERQLSQLESQSEALLGEKLSAESTCQSLQESLRKLQFQLDELQQSKDDLQTDVNTRGAAMRKLELQIGEWEGVGPFNVCMCIV